MTFAITLLVLGGFGVLMSVIAGIPFLAFEEGKHALAWSLLAVSIIVLLGGAYLYDQLPSTQTICEEE